MFEAIGPFTRPLPSVVPALLIAWAMALATLAAARPGRARFVVRWGSAAAALVGLAMVAWTTRHPALLSHVVVATRVGQLELVIAFFLDPTSSILSAGAFAVAACWRTCRPRNAIWIAIASMGAQIAVLGDGATTLVLGGAVASLAASMLGRPTIAAFVTDRVADVALAVAAALVFWLLGGSWIDGAYVSELSPRVVVASSESTQAAAADDDDDDIPRARAPVGSGTLTMTSLPGATVLVDGTWLRDGTSALRAPFGPVVVPGGSHTFRVHVGAGSDDYYVPRAQVGAGQALALSVRGPATTFREWDDQVGGMRDALARRKWSGVPVITFALLFVLVAFAARARLVPFELGSGEGARALAVFPAIAALARFAFVLRAVPETAGLAACALAVFATWSAAQAMTTRRLLHVLAAELAFAAMGFCAGASAVALLHAVVATTAFGWSRSVPRATHLALFFSRVAILGACAALPSGTLIVLLGAIATLFSVGALELFHHTSRRAIFFWLAAMGVALVAADSRSLGGGHASLAERIFSSGAPSPSLAAIALVAAITTFAIGAGRSTQALAQSAVLRFASHIALLPRSIGSIVRAAASAVAELESKGLERAVNVTDAVVRGIAWILSRVEVIARPAFRVPIPSPQAVPFAVASFAAIAIALFALPWFV